VKPGPRTRRKEIVHRAAIDAAFASRHSRLTEVINVVGGRRLAVIGYDRRVGVVIAEVEAAAAELSDIDFVGLPADTHTRRIAFGTWLFNRFGDCTQ